MVGGKNYLEKTALQVGPSFGPSPSSAPYFRLVAAVQSLGTPSFSQIPAMSNQFERLVMEAWQRAHTGCLNAGNRSQGVQGSDPSPGCALRPATFFCSLSKSRSRRIGFTVTLCVGQSDKNGREAIGRNVMKLAILCASRVLWQAQAAAMDVPTKFELGSRSRPPAQNRPGQMLVN